MENTQRLVDYIRSLPDFELVAGAMLPNEHMGATLTEAVLQAGINYDAVVRPRVESLLRAHPTNRTTSEFLRLLRENGTDVLLAWPAGSKKAVTLEELATFFVERRVETEEDLARWMLVPENPNLLLAIKGIGPKTVDYIRLLVGIPTVAVDVHLISFLSEAGIPSKTYEDRKRIITEAASVMDVGLTILDYSIWLYMSNRGRRHQTMDAD